MSLYNKALTKEGENYLNKILKIPSELKDLREYISKRSEIDLSISDSQVAFFRSFLKSQNPKNILEVGTFYGYSTACLAIYTSEDTKITTIDRDERSLEKAREQWDKLIPEVSNKITEINCKDRRDPNKINSEALSELNSLLSQNKKYDFIFIDADKNNYRNYFEVSLKMLEDGGAIIIDNIFQEGEIFFSTEEIEEKYKDNNPRKLKRILLMKELVEDICQDNSLSTSISPLGDGMLIVHNS
ncbi:MAG: O-methyltransferase [Alphaproteobacteria bacterium]|jgi:predicted O-methyltransferase YrrM|nr:O-methyltransferase [Alphaproteobacteria bacterium]